MLNDITDRTANRNNWKAVALRSRPADREIDGLVETIAFERFIALTADGDIDEGCENIYDVTHGAKIEYVEGIMLPLFNSSTSYYRVSWCACHADHPIVRTVIERASVVPMARQDWKLRRSVVEIRTEFERTGQVPEGFWPVADLPSYHREHGATEEKLFQTWLALRQAG